jgi:cytoskeletal protein CcmA (bactofilin family)
MSSRKLIFFSSIILLKFAVICSLVLATDEEQDIKAAGAKIKVISENANNIYVAGAKVSIEGNSNEDVWAAGAIVKININAKGDLHAAGAQLNLKGKIHGSARLAAADIKLDAEIQESFKAAAASIEIFENAKLNDKSYLAAALIDFRGTSEDDLKLIADEVVFSGQAYDSVVIEGRSVRLNDNARIEGDLIIHSKEKVFIPANASITGKVTQIGLEDAEFLNRTKDDKNGRGFFILLSTSIFLLGLIIVLFTSNFTERVISTLRSKPGLSIFWGLVVFIGIPIFVFIAIITIIGIPIGIATLLLLPFLLILSFTTTAFGISDLLLNKNGEHKNKGQRLLLLAFGVILFVVIGFVPILGGFLIFLALLLGLGAASATIGDYLSNKFVEKYA